MMELARVANRTCAVHDDIAFMGRPRTRRSTGWESVDDDFIEVIGRAGANGVDVIVLVVITHDHKGRVGKHGYQASATLASLGYYSSNQ